MQQTGLHAVQLQHTAGMRQAPHTGSIHQQPWQLLLAPAAATLIPELKAGELLWDIEQK